MNGGYPIFFEKCDIFNKKMGLNSHFFSFGLKNGHDLPCQFVNFLIPKGLFATGLCDDYVEPGVLLPGRSVFR